MSKPIFFYSKNCPLCQYLAEHFNIDWFQFFQMIDIDKKAVRDKVMRSKNVSITKVPCILVFKLTEDNKTIVNKYEGEIVQQWIVRNILQPLQQPRPIETKTDIIKVENKV